MTRLLRVAVVTVVGMTLACASLGKPLPEFQKKGEIYFAQRSASFDEYRVVGPLINMTMRSDGSWAGTFGSGPSATVVDVSYDNGFLRGSNISLKIEEHSAGIKMNGLWLGKQVRFEVDNNQVMVRTDNRSFTLNRTGEGLYGPDGNLRLEGEANLTNPPMPQFALAMLASLG